MFGTELVVAGSGEPHLQLVVHIPGARDTIRDFPDETFFLGSVDRPAQGDFSINRDDLHVLSVHRHVLRSENFFANLRGGGHVGLAVALIERSQGIVIAVANVARRVVRLRRRVAGEIRFPFVEFTLQGFMKG